MWLGQLWFCGNLELIGYLTFRGFRNDGPTIKSCSFVTGNKGSEPPKSVTSWAALLLHCFECHLYGATSGLLFPFREQCRVVLGDVIFVTRPEFLRCSIDPPRLAFDFAKNPDRRFIYHYI